MNTGRVLLLGASSQVGLFALPRLLARGLEVTAASRHGKPGWYPQFQAARWLDEQELRQGPLGDVSLLVSAGPIRLAADAIRTCTGLERAVVFSTSSVLGKRDSRDRVEQKQVQHILEQEAQLTGDCRERDIALTVLRPTLIYGCGLDANVSWLAHWIQHHRYLPIAGAASGLRQPVHADDLAAAATAALCAQEPLSLESPLCGGSTLSFRAMVERICAGLDRNIRIVSVPGGVLVAMLTAGRLLPGLRAVRPEMIRRENVDLVFDDRAAREVLAYQPRAFNPVAEDFELPAEAHLRDLALARAA